MPQIEALYNLPITPKIRFEHPRIVDAKVDAEKFSIWIVYIQSLLRMGLVSPDKAARMLELPGVYDEKKMQEWIDSAEQSLQPTNEIRKNQVAEESAVIE